MRPARGHRAGDHRDARFRVDFRPVDFFAADFRPVDFLAVDFLAVDFFAVDFLAVDLFALDFFAVVRFRVRAAFFADALRFRFAATFDFPRDEPLFTVAQARRSASSSLSPFSS